MNTQRSAFVMIPILMAIGCQTGHAATDKSANQAPPDAAAQMANTRPTQSAGDERAKAETLKYHMRVPINDSEQKTLDSACVKGPQAFYTWVGGSGFVKDHPEIINSAWPKAPGGVADSNKMCKMIQITIATNLNKYTGNAAGINYLKASDPVAARSIAAQAEHNP